MKLVKILTAIFLILITSSVFSLQILPDNPTDALITMTSAECTLSGHRVLSLGDLDLGDDCGSIIVERENRTNYSCLGTVPNCYADESTFYTKEELQEIENQRKKRETQNLINALSFYFFSLLLYLIIPAFLLYFSKNLLTKKILMAKVAITEANILLIFITPDFILISIILSVFAQAILSIKLYFKFKKIKEEAKIKTIHFVILLAEFLIMLVLIFVLLFLFAFSIPRF